MGVHPGFRMAARPADQLARPSRRCVNPWGVLLEKSAMGHAGRDHGLAALASNRADHEALHRAPRAMAKVMEPLSELILGIGGVMVTTALLRLRTGVRVVLGVCGLVLVAVGGALFAFVAYPRETLLFLSAGAGVVGTAWGYTRVTAWLTRRAVTVITVSGAAREPEGKS